MATMMKQSAGACMLTANRGITSLNVPKSSVSSPPSTLLAHTTDALLAEAGVKACDVGAYFTPAGFMSAAAAGVGDLHSPCLSPSTATPTSNQGGVAPQTPAIDLRRQLTDQNVFVFHLPSTWTEDTLRMEFGQFGDIMSCKVVKRPDGSSKGYGFVCFFDSSAAFRAVEEMNGRAVEGKRLKVSLKKTPEECLHLQVQKLMEISNANQPYDRDRDCTLFVFHLPATWDNADLFHHFESFGTLLSAKIAKKDDSVSRGYGFVTYDNPRAAALAIANMNGVEVAPNKRLKVQLKQQTSPPPQPSPGCTIFVFHTPNLWTDNHLKQHFNHFGKILGATVQRDALGNSKGYGFVSFEQRQSALNAVIGMNGFSVGHKRLKVSLKRGDERLSPRATTSTMSGFNNRGSPSSIGPLGGQQVPRFPNLGNAADHLGQQALVAVQQQQAAAAAAVSAGQQPFFVTPMTLEAQQRTLQQQMQSGLDRGVNNVNAMQLLRSSQGFGYWEGNAAPDFDPADPTAQLLLASDAGALSAAYVASAYAPMVQPLRNNENALAAAAVYPTFPRYNHTIHQESTRNPESDLNFGQRQ